MKISVRVFAIIALIALGVSLWTTPWIAVAWLIAGAIYFAWSATRQEREISELLRDPAFAGTPFDQAITRVRQRLKEGEQGLREREAEIAQRKQITNAVPDGLFLSTAITESSGATSRRSSCTHSTHFAISANRSVN